MVGMESGNVEKLWGPGQRVKEEMELKTMRTEPLSDCREQGAVRTRCTGRSHGQESLCVAAVQRGGEWISPKERAGEEVVVMQGRAVGNGCRGQGPSEATLPEEFAGMSEHNWWVVGLP